MWIRASPYVPMTIGRNFFWLKTRFFATKERTSWDRPYVLDIVQPRISFLVEIRFGHCHALGLSRWSNLYFLGLTVRRTPTRTRSIVWLEFWSFFLTIVTEFPESFLAQPESSLNVFRDAFFPRCKTHRLGMKDRLAKRRSQKARKKKKKVS